MGFNDEFAPPLISNASAQPKPTEKWEELVNFGPQDYEQRRNLSLRPLPASSPQRLGIVEKIYLDPWPENSDLRSFHNA